MPKLFKVFLIGFGLLCWVIPLSVSISFIYSNRYFIEISTSYLVLFVIYITFVVFQHRIEEKQYKSFFQRLSIERKLGFVISSFFFPLLVGYSLSLLTPLIADLSASELALHEYTVIKASPYAKSFRQLSKLDVIDIHGNQNSFIIKNEMLNKLQLRKNEKLIASGRRCIAGFVIDNINGVPRQ